MTARTVVLWRHGRTAYNAARRLQGQVDIPLDEVGQWQAGLAARTMQLSRKPALIVASDLSRAAATAAAFAELLDMPVESDARLRERNFGEWEGLSVAEIEDGWPEQFRAWHAGLDPQDVGAETRAAVAARVSGAIEDHAARIEPGEELLVVSHGAALTLGITALLGLDPVQWRGLGGFDNAHWSELHSSGPGRSPRWRLVAHNRGPDVGPSEWNSGPEDPSAPPEAQA